MFASIPAIVPRAKAFLVSSDGDPGDGPAPGFRRALIVEGNDGVAAPPGGATAGVDSIET